jgi:hypothetical protein
LSQSLYILPQIREGEKEDVLKGERGRDKGRQREGERVRKNTEKEKKGGREKLGETQGLVQLRCDEGLLYK